MNKGEEMGYKGNMKQVGMVLGLFCLVFGAAVGASAAEKLEAKAELIDAQGKPVGAALLEGTPKGVKINLRVSGLPPGRHALHIHETGKCDPPDFKSTGGHFNPTHKKHGWQNPEGHHAGDLPDFVVDESGRGGLDALIEGVTLSGQGENSLFHPGGTSVVIHASADDNKTDPSGNSGARIACGVITASAQ